MKPTEEDKKLLDILLSSDKQTVAAILNDPKLIINAFTEMAMELIWQLHPDEEIKNLAEKHLEKIMSTKRKSQLKHGFEIFCSLNELLPWLDDKAAAVQNDNFIKFQQLLPDFEYLLSHYPLYSEIFLDAGRKLFMIFNMQEAAKIIFETVVLNNPDNDEALYALGRTAERAMENERALALYEKAIFINPNNSFAQMKAGQLKCALYENYDEAVVHFLKASEDDPYAVEPYIKIAEACYLLNDIPRCRQYLEIALGINEYQEEALNLLGTLQWKIDQKHDEALATFQKGIDHKIHQDSALLLKSLGDIQKEHYLDFRKARVFYEKSFKINPAQPQLLLSLIPILIKDFQDIAAAEQLYLDYLKVLPADVDIRADFAEFLVDYLNDYDAAHTHLHLILTDYPEHSEASRLMRKIGDYLLPEIEYVEDSLSTIISLDDEDFEETIFLSDEDDDDDDDDDDDFSGGGAATDF